MVAAREQHVPTAANVHDKHALPDLLHGDEQRVYGDRAYASQKELIAGKAPKAKDLTNDRVRNRSGEADEIKRARNRNKSKIRARVGPCRYTEMSASPSSRNRRMVSAAI